MSISGNITLIVSEPVRLPAWRVGQSVNEWRKVSGTAPHLPAPTNVALRLDGSSASTGPRARFESWNGYSVDTRASKIWALANGGHGDYFGNEVLCLNLLSDNPGWVEWLSGSSGNVVDSSGTYAAGSPQLARYLDGRPASAHSYFGQQFIERQNAAVRFGGSYAPGGTAFSDVEAFDAGSPRGANGWAPQYAYPPIWAAGGTINIAWAMCKDPRDEVVYVLPATGPLRKFTPVGRSGGVWTSFGADQPRSVSSFEAASAIDTKRNRLMYTHGGYGSVSITPYTIDLTLGGFTAQSHPPSTAKDGLDALRTCPGMVYIGALDAYLVRGSTAGGGVFAIQAGTFEVSMLSTTGGSLIPVGAFIVGAAGANYENVHTHWLHVPTLGGVLYFPAHDQDGWFLRLY